MLNRPFCRCLLEDLPSGAELAANIRELIEQLPPERRAPEETVRTRLSACLACNHLYDGLCALCGCYVELRAAGQPSRCPDLPDRWRAAEAASAGKGPERSHSAL